MRYDWTQLEGIFYSGCQLNNEEFTFVGGNAPALQNFPRLRTRNHAFFFFVVGVEGGQ